MAPSRATAIAPPPRNPRKTSRRRRLRSPLGLLGRLARRRSPGAGGSASVREQAARSGRSATGMHERFRARRQQVRDAGLRRRRRIVGSLAALLAVVVLAVGLSFSPLFAIAEVQVTGLDGPREQEVRRVAGVTPGQNLLFADLVAAQEAVAGLPYVADAEVRRVPPSTLEVAVSLRDPVAVVRLASESWLVDDTGTVVAGGTLPDLVPIDAPGTLLPPVGEQVGPSGVRTALAFHTGLPASLRDRVERYEAPSTAEVRVFLRPEPDPRAPADGSEVPDASPPPAEGTPEGGPPVTVLVGGPEQVEAKAQAITLLLERVGAEPDLDLTGFELDVRAPGNPVLRPLP